MANYIVNGNDLTAIANAIREKTASTETMKVSDMSLLIKKIVVGTGPDVSQDTVIPEALTEGYIAHNAAGELIEGINPYELNSTNNIVSEQSILIEQIEEVLKEKGYSI